MTRLELALHEAAHLVVCRGERFRVESVSLRADSRSLAHVVHSETNATGRLRSLIAGPVADVIDGRGYNRSGEPGTDAREALDLALSLSGGEWSRAVALVSREARFVGAILGETARLRASLALRLAACSVDPIPGALVEHLFRDAEKAARRELFATKRGRPERRFPERRPYVV